METKEYSFEDFFASGTGIEPEKTETISISSEKFDGYIDGISMEMYQSNEDIEFLNSFEAVSYKNAQDKIMMLKKLKANYNNKSIESYCDKQIQSFGFSKKESTDNKEKSNVGEKIKDKIIMVFKKIAEFIRHLFDVITNMKYRGTTVDNVKAGLKIVHDSTMEFIKFASNKSDFSNEVKEKIQLKQKILNATRLNCLNTLKCLNLAYKYAKKSGKTGDTKNMGEFIDSDLLEKVVPELRGVKTVALNDSLLRKTLSALNTKIIFTEDSINATDKKEFEKTLEIYNKSNEALINLQENLKKKIEGLNNSKESLEQKDVKKIKFDISYSQNKKYENHKLINVISKIEKEKNIWMPEQLQIFYFKYNDNNFGSVDINKLPDLDHYKSFDCLSDVLMDTSKLKPETLKFLIPFIAMGNGDYVCVYKDDSIIYYSHDGKTTFEKLDYKDLNEFCNSFISDKDWKKLEKKGISMDKEFFK